MPAPPKPGMETGRETAKGSAGGQPPRAPFTQIVKDAASAAMLRASPAN